MKVKRKFKLKCGFCGIFIIIFSSLIFILLFIVNSLIFRMILYYLISTPAILIFSMIFIKKSTILLNETEINRSNLENFRFGIIYFIQKNFTNHIKKFIGLNSSRILSLFINNKYTEKI